MTTKAIGSLQIAHARKRKPKPKPPGKHNPLPIDVVFVSGLTDSQKSAFSHAATRWARVLAATLPPIRFQGSTISGVRIFAKGASIDGPGSILGQAGPRFLRPNSFLPAVGDMEFDSSDLWTMEQNGTLNDVITHEMGHVLGIGTIWSRIGLLRGAGTANPVFTGTLATQEFTVLLGSAHTGAIRGVPVENTGGEGTRDGHWRDRVFGNELMTSFIADEGNPLSRMTIASLEDMGYSVNYSAAEPYALPSHLALSIMGVGADRPHAYQCSTCSGRRRAEPEILPLTALIGS